MSKITSRIAIILLGVVLLSGAGNCAWKVNLTPTPFYQDDAKTKLADQIHTATVELGTGDFSRKVQASFDTTTITNWFIDQKTNPTLPAGSNQKRYQCKPPCKFDEQNGVRIVFPDDATQSININGNRVKFESAAVEGLTKIGRNSTDRVVFSNQQQISEISFLVPNKLSRPDGYQVITKNQAAFGLGRPDSVELKQSNFVNKVNTSGEKLQQNGFSLFIHDSLSQVLFGEPESFFGNQPRAIRNLAPSQYWKTRLIKLLAGPNVIGSGENDGCAGQNDPVQFTGGHLPCDTPAAGTTTYTIGKGQPDTYFDTTTQFIYAPRGQLDKLIESININFKTTISFNADRKLYQAPCEQDKLSSFPPVKFYFFEVEQPFVVESSEYLVYDATKSEKKCWLNFKPNFDTNNVDWYLGTTFFKSNYCHFDQVKNNINCSPAFQFTPGNQNISDQSRIIALILGAFLLVGAIAVLLSVFTRVPPFQPSSVPQPSPTRDRNYELGLTYIQQNNPPAPTNNNINTSNRFPSIAPPQQPAPAPFNNNQQFFPYNSQQGARYY